MALRIAAVVLFLVGLMSLLFPSASGPGGTDGRRPGLQQLDPSAWAGWAEMGSAVVVAVAPTRVASVVLAGTGTALLGYRVAVLDPHSPCPCLAGVRERLGLAPEHWDPWLVALASWFFLLGALGACLVWTPPRPWPVNPRGATLWGLGLVLGLFWFLFFATGAWRQTVVGPDDPFELVKALFLSRHRELGHLIWNDQPWLHTLINAQGLKWFGDDVLWPRLFQMLSVTAFWCALGWLSYPRMGAVGLTATALFLVSNQHTFPLWFSVMLEPAALAWACVAAALLSLPDRVPPAWRVVLSGLVMAAATHMKFTAAVTAPGLVTLVWARYGFWAGLRMLPWWLGGFAGGFFLFLLLSPSFRWEWLLEAHWKARSAAGGSPDWPHLSEYFLRTGWIPLTVAAVWGLATLFRKPRPAVGWWAVGVLGGAAAFALMARPWWMQYELQWQIPMACLGALAMQDAWERIQTRQALSLDPATGAPQRSKSDMTAAPGGATTLLAWTTVGALWMGHGTAEWTAGMASVRSEIAMVDPGRVDLMKTLAPHIQWAYAPAQAGGELFAAGVCPPPELLVLSAKRSGSGWIDQTQLRILLQGRQPEILLLGPFDLSDSLLMSWVRLHYERVHKSRLYELWISKRLNPLQILDQDPRQHMLGPPQP